MEILSSEEARLDEIEEEVRMCSSDIHGIHADIQDIKSAIQWLKEIIKSVESRL